MTRFPFSVLFSVIISTGLLVGCTSPASEPAVDAAVVENKINDPWSSWDGFGTVFLTPDVITPKSPSDFVGLSFVGIEDRETFDRRVDDWVTNASWIFTATYRCARPSVEVIVNPEFTEAEALEEATRVAQVLGRIPVGARAAVREIWIHDGNELAGGGNNAIMLYSDYVTLEFDWLEEVFIHEGAHASLDYDFGGAVNKVLWAAAVESDGQFISQYAADNPDREDIAESYGAFLVWALHRDEGIFSESAAQIEALIPARLKYFESLGPDFGLLPASCRP